MGYRKNDNKTFQAVFTDYPGIEKMIIYGSRAKGTFREGSDIDITLKGENLNLDITSKLKLAIDDLNTPYFYDISVYHKLTSEDLRKHIDTFWQVFL